MKKGQARQCPITGKNKCDLCKMIRQLKGGYISTDERIFWKKENLWDKSVRVFPLHFCPQQKPMNQTLN